jgi:hypothetical protein
MKFRALIFYFEKHSRRKNMKYMLSVMMICCSLSLVAEDWPREVLSSEGTITMYQPQIESYSGNSLKARAAVSMTLVGKEEPVFGALWITCRVFTDRPTRLVRLEEMEVRRIRFPAGTDADTAAIAEVLEDVIPRSDLTFSLDLLLESIETAQKEKENARELEVNPPKIIIVNHPAVLVQIDGDPIYSSVAGTSLRRIVNTPYFLVQDLSERTFYLRGGERWFRAKKIKGPWRPIAIPTTSVLTLSNQLNYEDASTEVSAANDMYLMTGKVPEIMVSTEPTELIATDGPMKFIPIDGTGLLYVSNTPTRLFVEIKTQKRFILISGRWYSAKSATGPWVYIASDKLPVDFQNIPPGSVCDDVLASVAGTIPAKEAIYDAQIPQMAEVDRTETSTHVEYDGEPQFDPIENTGMEYAVNTSTAVIRVNGRFYDCDRGIWFESYSPVGPWQVCIHVPEIIYTIPSRCPVYHVRYVRVYNFNQHVVTVGYTAGYTGCYVYNRTVVYGTGYHYDRWYKKRYYARPWTWGFNIHYNPWMGWSFGPTWGQSHRWFAHHDKEEHDGWWGSAVYHPHYIPDKKPVYRQGYHPAYQEKSPNAPVVNSSNDGRRASGMSRSATLYDNRSTGVRRPATSEISRPSQERSRTTPASPRPSEAPQATSPATQPAAQSVPRTETPRVPRQSEIPRANSPVPQPPTPSIPTVETPRVPRQPEIPQTTRPRTPPVVQPATQAIPRNEGTRIETHPSKRENNVFADPHGNIMRNGSQGWQQRDQNTWKKADDSPAKQETVRDSEVRQRAAERSSSPRTAPAPPTEIKRGR